MQDIAVYKLSRIEQALDSLSRAVDRLEAASEGLGRSHPVADAISSSEEALRLEIADLRADYDNLRTISQTVSQRLENAIGRVRAVLGP